MKGNQACQLENIIKSYQKIVVAALLSFAHGTTHDPDGVLKVRPVGCVVEKHADELATTQNGLKPRTNLAARVVPSLTRLATQHDGIRTVKDGILKGK